MQFSRCYNQPFPSRQTFGKLATFCHKKQFHGEYPCLFPAECTISSQEGHHSLEHWALSLNPGNGGQTHSQLTLGHEWPSAAVTPFMLHEDTHQWHHHRRGGPPSTGTVLLPPRHHLPTCPPAAGLSDAPKTDSEMC